MAKTLSNSGITTNDTIRAGHVTQSVDALTGTDAYDITISGSLSLPGTVASGSFMGDGTGLTGVTGEWDGSHNGNASITGSLTVTGGVSGSISLNDGQTIDALNGGGQLDLRSLNTDGVIVLNTSASNYEGSYLYMTPGVTGEAYLQGGNDKNYFSLNNGEVNIGTENGLILSGSYIRPFGQNVTDLGFPTRLFKTIYGVTGSFDYLKNSNSSTITVQDSITFQSAITASGDISSSGTYLGDGSQLTNLQRPISNSVSTNVTASNLNSGYYFRTGGNITCSIQSNAIISCDVGSEFDFFQTSSAGNLLFHTGSGVTLNSKNGSTKLSNQFSAATLKKIDTNEWDLIGDLS